MVIPAVDRPAIVSVPSFGVRMHPRIERSVVLPLPDGPISSVSSPGRTSRLTPFSARTWFAPSPRIFTIPRASRMAPAGSSDICVLLIRQRLKTTAGSMRVTLKMAQTAAKMHMPTVRANSSPARPGVMTISSVESFEAQMINWLSAMPMT